MPTFPITPAVPADAETIAEFNVALAAESEHLVLDPPTVLAGVQAVLADPAKGRYFVARSPAGTAGPAVLGQLMLTVEWSDWRNGPMWWIQSVYVRPDHRRQGIFRALFRHALELAAAEGVPVVRLYVERENVSAREAYASLGMSDSGYLVLERVLPRAEA